MRKIYLVQTLFLLVCLNLSCNKKVGEINFCEILKKDQSNINNNPSSQKYKEDRDKRISDINGNFDLLIRFTKKNGFPTNLNQNQDSCMKEALQITFIHAAQVNQQELFKESTIQLLKKEIDNGNLDNELLKRAIIIMALTSSVCENYKKNIAKAIIFWGLEKATFKEETIMNLTKEMNFIKC